MKKIFSLLLFGASITFMVDAQEVPWLSPFDGFYKNELGSTKPCSKVQDSVYRVCSSALKNDGNAPYVYHHNQPTDTTVVLFHGLSDSPYFLSSIAPAFHNLGYTVIVALLPGHGKLDADDDMEDGDLAKRWTKHVKEVMDFAHTLSPNIYLGGFSTGGALATQYALDNQDKVKGLLLFSGALALDESVENMAGYWGIKLLANILDWTYETQGPNPYKYPSVAKHGAFMLTDIIFDVRKKIEQGKTPDLAIFSAHSEADVTTPIRGVKQLLAANKGDSVTFFIAKEFDVCHADLVVNDAQITHMAFDASMVDASESCAVPKANPKHAEMLDAAVLFLRTTSANNQEVSQ
ncbi:alpha/beta hydrolase [Aliiglaciecola litoralis]|uniref:Serine aminopeptidase S33 domain-containing protein n=1 Tax=Aliiglaciecola litoralis TaxID=582857 RepID=A0ABN1LJ40_9ALTE